MNRITEVVKNLLIINVIIFFGTMALPAIKIKGVLFFPLSNYFEPYQIVSHMFLHADFQHLLFNMLTLFFLGPIVEQAIGAKKFLILYFTSGLGALLLHWGLIWFQYQGALDVGSNYQIASIINTPMLGASGAVYGVLIAFATLFPNMKLMLLFPPIPIKAKYLAVGLIALGLFSQATGFQGNVAHFAHIGGAIVGFVMIRFVWKMQSLR